MKHIFIVGARGYHYNYGGWETFVSNLVDYYNDKNTIFHISMITDDKNLKEKKISNNIFVNPIYVKTKGSIKMFIYSIRAYRYYLKYIKENELKNSYIYVLGLKLFNYLWLKERFVKNNGIKVYVNPDGLEWMRSKWSYPVKKFFLLSEILMLNHCDKIICDGLGIQKYVCNKYPKLKDKTTYIAYGYEKFDFKDVSENKILDKYSLTSDNYCLMVGRCVPENNYELVIKDFMKSKIDKELIIVCNYSSSSYYQKLIQMTECFKDKRIKFIDGVYDRLELAVLRKNAYLYIHGHSVGGTNPSLIEALSLTDLCILYDVCFNHDIGLENCLYFKNESSLTKILDNKKLLASSRDKFRFKAKKMVSEKFTWDIIVDKYKQIFR